MAEKLVNNALGTLSANLNGSSDPATLTLTSTATTLGFPSSGNFRVLIDGEILLATAVSGSSLTVSRAQEGTSIAAHSAGALVAAVLTGGSIGTYVTENAMASLTLVNNATTFLSTANVTLTPASSTLTLTAASSLTLTAASSSTVPLTVKGAPSQSAHLQDWKDSGNTVKASVSASGNITGNLFAGNGLDVGGGNITVEGTSKLDNISPAVNSVVQFGAPLGLFVHDFSGGNPSGVSGPAMAWDSDSGTLKITADGSTWVSVATV